MRSGPPAGGVHRFEFSEEPDDPAWDAFVERTPEGSHVQTSIWGQLKATEGWEPVRMLVRRGDQIVAGAQALVRQLPMRNAVAYVPKGPILDLDDTSADQIMLDGLGHFAERYRIRHLSVQPPNNGLRFVPLLQGARYRTSDTPVAPVATLQIDLYQELDQILAGMHKNHRRYVRHGQRQGVIGRTGTESDLESFYRLVVATSRRQGFTPHSFEHFVNLWRLFHPRGLLQMFLAEYRGELVSGQVVISFGDRVVTKNSGWTGQHGSLGPNHVMDWTSLQWAKKHGYRYYDLEGIDSRVAELIVAGEPLPERLLRSHSIYKLGFGGEIAQFPRTHVLVPNPLLAWGYWTLFPRLGRMRSVQSAVNRLRVHPGSSV